MSQKYDGSIRIDATITDEKVKKGLDSIQRSTESAAKDIEDSFGRASKSVIKLAAAYMGLNKALSSISAGVAYNKQLESAQLGIASIVASTFELRDAQGQVLAGQEKFAAAQRMSLDMAKALDVASMQSTAAYTDLLSSFQTNLAPAAQMGLAWQDTLDVTIRMSNVLESMGLSMEFLNYETQRILTGNDFVNSRVAKRLGLTREEIKAWGEGEKFMENFNRRFEAFVYSGQAAEKTFSAVSAYFTDTLQSLSAEAGKGLFESLKASMLEVADAFYEIDSASKSFKITEEMQPLVTLVQDMLTGLGDIGKDVTEGFVDSLRALSGFIDKNQGAFDRLGAGIKTIAANFDVAVVGIGAYTVAQKVAKSSADGWIATQRQEIQVWREKAHVEAEAELIRAKAQQDAAIMNQAQVAWKTRQVDLIAKSMIGTENESRAVAMLSVQQKKLAAADAEVAVATVAVDAAQKKAIASTNLFAIAQVRLRAVIAAARTAFLGLVKTVLPIAAITALTSAIYKLATRQSDSERIAEKYSSTIAGIKGSAKDAQSAIEELERATQGAGESKLKALHEETKADLRAIESELAKFQERAVRYRDRSGQTIEKIVGSGAISDMVKELMEGGKAVKDFEDAIYKLFNDGQIDLTMRDSLIDLAYKYEAVKTKVGVVDEAIQRFIQTNNTASNSYTASAQSTDALVEAMNRLNQAAKVESIDDAIKILSDLTINTDAAKEAAVDLKKAKAEEAIAFIQTQIAGAEYAAQMADVAAADAFVAGDQAGLEAALKRKQEALEAAATAAAMLADYQAAINAPGFTWSGGSSSSTSTTKKELIDIKDYLKQFYAELAVMQGEGGAEFTLGLSEGLKKLENDLKGVAGVTRDTTEALKKQFTEAFAAKTIQDFTDKIDQLEGRSDEVVRRKLAADAETFAAALKAAGMNAEEAAAEVQRFYDAASKDIDKANLETLTGFLRELSEMSGDRNIGIAQQNELLEIQAGIFRDLLPESMKEYADAWLQLKKEQADDSWLGGAKEAIQDYFNEWTKESSIAQKQVQAGLDFIGGAADQVIDGIFDGAEIRVDQLFKDLAKQLMKIALNQMFAGILQGMFGGGGAVSTFSTGGYTGDAPKDQIVGAVHGKEYVLNADATKNIGVQNLNALNRGVDLGVVAQLSQSSNMGGRFVSEQRAPVNTSIIYSPTIDIDYSAPEGSNPVADAQQMAEIVGSRLRRDFERMIDQRIMTNTRPGGLLNRGIGG